MSNSALISHTRISPNSSNPRNKPITKITPHHMAGNMTLAQFGELVARPSRQMSANYAIDSNGNIGLFCEEKNRSWCSSSSANDNMAVTIEVANDGGAPNWHVSDKALAALIALCADICERNGIEALNFTGNATGNLTQHNYFTATACPGPYLKSKFPYIAEEVNKILKERNDPMLIATWPVRLKIGPMSGGDMNAVKNLLDGLQISYSDSEGYLITDVAVSGGDQKTIVEKAVALQLGYGPYCPGGDTAALEAKLGAVQQALSAEQTARAEAEADLDLAMAKEATKAKALKNIVATAQEVL